ncbi:MAG: helix-turn-helix domain-containing protein [Bacteroidia bacterium]
METNHEKPMWHYSMDDFLSVQEKRLMPKISQMMEDLIEKTVNNVAPKEDTIDVKEACKVTGLKEKTIYAKVSRLELPSKTRGRPLMFSRKELESWMKLGKPTVTDMGVMRRKNEI